MRLFFSRRKIAKVPLPSSRSLGASQGWRGPRMAERRRRSQPRRVRLMAAGLVTRYEQHKPVYSPYMGLAKNGEAHDALGFFLSAAFLIVTSPSIVGGRVYDLGDWAPPICLVGGLSAPLTRTRGCRGSDRGAAATDGPASWSAGVFCADISVVPLEATDHPMV